MDIDGMVSMSAVASAFRKAGYATPRERLEAMMVEVIESVEKLMSGVVEKRGLRGPSIAEFSRRLLERNDAAMIWELMAYQREQILSELFDKVYAQLRGELDKQLTVNAKPTVVQNTARALPPPPPALVSAAAIRAIGSNARKSLLSTFTVNGRALGAVSAKEAREFAASRKRDGRFLEMLTANLPDHVIVGDAVSDEEAERAYSAAENE